MFSFEIFYCLHLTNSIIFLILNLIFYFWKVARFILQLSTPSTYNTFQFLRLFPEIRIPIMFIWVPPLLIIPFSFCVCSRNQNSDIVFMITSSTYSTFEFLRLFPERKNAGVILIFNDCMMNGLWWKTFNLKLQNHNEFMVKRKFCDRLRRLGTRCE